MYRSRRGIFFLKEEICLVELEKKSRRMIGGQASSPSLPKERSKLGQSAKGQKSRKFRAIGYRGQRSSPGNGGDGGEKGEEPPIRGQLLNFITPCRPTLLSPLVLRVTCPRGVEGRLNVTQTTCALSLSLSPLFSFTVSLPFLLPLLRLGPVARFLRLQEKKPRKAIRPWHPVGTHVRLR